jgi:hypothetical protein
VGVAFTGLGIIALIITVKGVVKTTYKLAALPPDEQSMGVAGQRAESFRVKYGERGSELMRVFFLAMFSVAVLAAQQPSPRKAVPFPPDIVPQEVRDGAEALRADPKHYHLDFENDQIRALRLTLKGVEAVPFYDARDALLVCLKDCYLRVVYPGMGKLPGEKELLGFKDSEKNKRIQDVHIEAGKSLWIFGNARSVKNLSIEPLELLLIEPKVVESSK